MVVKIQLNALPAQKHGELKGKITYISADTVSENVDGQPGNFYRARAEITESGLKDTPPGFNIMPGMKIIIPVGCIGHVFGLFQKCEDKSDIDLNRIIRIRDWNKGGKITFDGKRIYAVEKDKKITNLPLLTTTISPGFKSISWMNKL